MGSRRHGGGQCGGRSPRTRGSHAPGWPIMIASATRQAVRSKWVCGQSFQRISRDIRHGLVWKRREGSRGRGEVVCEGTGVTERGQRLLRAVNVLRTTNIEMQMYRLEHEYTIQSTQANSGALQKARS